jgi:glycosyltransferase involved in cell wall biosynthesis
MFVLHTESSCGWGGQEIRILTEARGLMERGHRIELAAALGSPIAEEAKRFDVPVHRLAIKRKGMRGFLGLRGLILRSKPDVVNSHSSTDSWLSAFALHSSGRPAPLVRTRHVSSPIPQNAATRWLYGKASSFVVTTGRSLRDQVLVETPAHADKVMSVPTGIDFSCFRPACLSTKRVSRLSCGLPPDSLLIGTLSTLRSWKGHRYLIDAFASLLHRDVHLVIVGDGPQASSLRQQVFTLRLNNRVTFAGNQPDVLPWLHSLDVFAMPSFANEGIPQAMLQAMGCGIATVTTNAGAIPELAHDGQTAWVAKKKDAVSLASALTHALDNPALRELRSKAAREFVTAHHSVGRMVDDMENVFAVSIHGHRKVLPPS